MAKKSKTRRRRYGVRGLNKNDISSFATQTLLPAAAGAVAGQFLNRLPFIKDNPQYAPWAGIVLGAIAATSSQNAMLQAAGTGMAVVSAAQVAGDVLDGTPRPNGVKGVGLLPPGMPSRGIAGNEGVQLEF